MGSIPGGPSTHLLSDLLLTALHAGAELRQWYLGGTATGDIQLQDSNNLNAAAGTSPSGGMAAVFTVNGSPQSLPLIFAAGGVYSDGTMRWVLAVLRCAALLGQVGHARCGAALCRWRGPCCRRTPAACLHHVSSVSHTCLPRRQHGQYGSGTLDLSTGTLSDPEVESKAISSLIAVRGQPRGQPVSSLCLKRHALKRCQHAWPPCSE